MSDIDLLRAARELILRELLAAYEDAGLSGLCAEGRLELAVDRVRGLDLEALLAAAKSEDSGIDR